MSTRPLGRPWGWALLVVVLSQPAVAQRWQLDVSGTRVAFDTLATLNSASLAPSVELHSGRLYATLGASVSGLEAGDWAAQGRGDLSLLLDPWGPISPLRVEVLGVASGTYHSSTFRTSALRGESRFHVGGRYAGAWAGATLATGWASGSSDLVTALGPTMGLWGRYGTARAVITFAPLQIDGSWFAEWNGRASMVAGPVDLAAYAGWRDSARSETIAPSAWAGGVASLWLSRNLAVVIGGGSYGADLLQALPRGRYLTAALRLAQRRAAVPSIAPLGRPAYERENGSGMLRLRVPRATRVAVAGDWTEWQPVPMQRAPDGTWMLRLSLAPGVYRFSLIVDGQTWVVPEEVPSVDDGLSGRTGLLIVP